MCFFRRPQLKGGESLLRPKGAGQQQAQHRAGWEASGDGPAGCTHGQGQAGVKLPATVW